MFACSRKPSICIYYVVYVYIQDMWLYVYDTYTNNKQYTTVYIYTHNICLYKYTEY